jgi:hypothetical protein
MSEWRTGDPVEGQICPGCRRFTVVYNGNYFCTHCQWSMSKDVPRITKAYLIQRRQHGLDVGDVEEVKTMDFYLINYADEVKA